MKAVDEKCKGSIWRNYHSYPCKNRAWQDGYCKQHHPGLQKERRDKRYAEYLANLEREKAKDPRTLLAKALEREKIIMEVYERYKGTVKGDGELLPNGLIKETWQAIKRFVEARNATD